jgi:hypothetical protein
MSDEMLMSGGDSQLDRARVLLQQWLHQTLLYPGVKESQVLRNFLCANANMPPPRLDITWANRYCPSLDEMEMDELFDRHLEEREDADNQSDDEVSRQFGYTSDGGGQGQEMGMSCASHRGEGALGRGGAPGGNLDHDLSLDLPSQDDIASSVPVEISFRDPRGAASSAAEGGGESDHKPPPPKVGLANFKIIRVIGKGSFGKVYLVREKLENKIYAMKVSTSAVLAPGLVCPPGNRQLTLLHPPPGFAQGQHHKTEPGRTYEDGEKCAGIR